MELLISPTENVQEDLQHARQDRYAFSNPAERAKHVRLFFAWLSPILRDAPGIEWDQLPRGCTRSQAACFSLYLTNCFSVCLAKRVSIKRSMVR